MRLPLHMVTATVVIIPLEFLLPSPSPYPPTPLPLPTGPVILILYNAGPLDISWAKDSDRVMAILEQFFPAQTAGTALSNVLTGKYNPAGRLPNTWPASLEQVSLMWGEGGREEGR